MKNVRFLIFGFLFGVWQAYFVAENDYFWFLICLIPLFWFYFSGLIRRVIVLWFLFGLFLGVWRFYFVDANFVGLQFFEGKREFHGCVVREVDVRSDNVKYTLEVEGVESLVLLNNARYPVYRYGDCLDFVARLDFPEAIEDFRYDLYLKRYGIGYTAYYPQIVKVYPRDGLSVFALMNDLKVVLNDRIAFLFGEPTGSLVSGLLLGSRKGIPAHLTEDFKRVGLTHIVAISGYNITILILFVGRFFAFFSRRVKVVLSILAICGFVVLVGAGASVVRAGIMGGISLLAIFFGRQYFVGFVVLMTAFLMSVWNPYILLFDSGFHLSFMATLGLIYLVPLLERFGRFLPKSFLIRESILMTVSAQLMVLPLSISSFHGFSWIAPVVNLIVLPFIPLLMLFSALAVFGLGFVPAFSVEVLVDILVRVVQFFADLPFGFLTFNSSSVVFFCFYYLVLFLFIRRRYYLPRESE